MGSDWQPHKLGDLGPIKTGKTPSTKVPEHFGGKIPFVTPRDMDGRKRIVGTERYLTEKGARAVGSALIPAGSIMVSCIGSDMGKVAIAGRECVTNQQINSIVVAEEYASEYVYYDLSQRKSELRSMASGSAQPILNKGHFSQVAIEIPDFPEQRAIAHILGSLDDKIELNRRMNETLEAMARAIFKSWFIDFDPVIDKALRAGNPIPDSMAERAEIRRQILDQNQPSSPGPFSQGEKGRNYRGGYDFSGFVETARDLRKKQTPPEAIFWEMLRGRRFIGLKFRRQHQIGDYIADFYCHEQRLVIELDGGIHTPKQKKDHKRDAWMEAQGFKVLRFPNEQVLEDPESVLQAIAQSANPTATSHRQDTGGSTESNSSPFGRGWGEGSVEELNRLFPDSFEDSELGEIPKGWEVVGFPELVDKYIDNRGKTPPIVEKGIPLVEVKHLPEGCIKPNLNTTKYVSKETYEQWFRSHLEPFDIIISTVGTIGRICIVPPNSTFAIAQNLLGIRFRKDVARSLFMYYQLSNRRFRDDVDARLVITVQKSIKRKDLVTINLLKPPLGIQMAFEKFVRSNVTFQLSNSNLTLASLRETLLPKLISGELRVPDAENFVEEAGTHDEHLQK